MRIRATPRKWVLGGAAIGVVLLLALTTFAGPASGKAQHVTWDIIHFSSVAGTVTFSPGGFAEAQSQGPTGFGPIRTLRLAGHGTFVAPSSGRGSGAVTGGGTWTISEAGTPVANGTYVVTELVSWEFAGTQTGIPGATIVDTTGNVNERANGTAVLRISFSDGDWGILTVGCHGPGAPDRIFEGIASTKSFETYYTVQNPAPGVDLNRTIFHVVG